MTLTQDGIAPLSGTKARDTLASRSLRGLLPQFLFHTEQRSVGLHSLRWTLLCTWVVGPVVAVQVSSQEAALPSVTTTLSVKWSAQRWSVQCFFVSSYPTGVMARAVNPCYNFQQ